MSIYFFPGIGISRLYIPEFPLKKYNLYSISNEPLNEFLLKKKGSLKSFFKSNLYILFPFIYCCFTFYSSFAIFFIFNSFRSIIYDSKIKSLNKPYFLISTIFILIFLYFTREIFSLINNCNSKILCISMESTEDVLVDYLVSFKTFGRFSKNVNIRKVNYFMINDFEFSLNSYQINLIIEDIWPEKDWNRISKRIKKQHVHSQSRDKFQNIQGYLREIMKSDFIDQKNKSVQVYSNDFNFLTFFFYKFPKTIIFMVLISTSTLISYFYFRKSMVIFMKILLIVLNIIFLTLFFIFFSYYKMISKYQDSPKVFINKLQNLSNIFTNIYKKNLSKEIRDEILI